MQKALKTIFKFYDFRQKKSRCSGVMQTANALLVLLPYLKMFAILKSQKISRILRILKAEATKFRFATRTKGSIC